MPVKHCRTAGPSAAPVNERRTVTHHHAFLIFFRKASTRFRAPSAAGRAPLGFFWLVLPGNILLVTRTAIHWRSAPPSICTLLAPRACPSRHFQIIFTHVSDSHTESWSSRGINEPRPHPTFLGRKGMASHLAHRPQPEPAPDPDAVETNVAFGTRGGWMSFLLTNVIVVSDHFLYYSVSYP